MPSTIMYSTMDRKVKKPLMEKRRRARINQCLAELKGLLLQNCQTVQQTNQQRMASKLEKADILEMTVQYVRSQQSIVTNCGRDDNADRRYFVDGYTHCAQLASQFVPHTDRHQFMTHLSLTLNDRLKNIADRSSPSSSELTLSIPNQNGFSNVNQASQPTPPFTLSNCQSLAPTVQSAINHQSIDNRLVNNLISPCSTSISSGCDSPFSCSSTSGFCSSSSSGTTEMHGLLTPVTPVRKNGNGNIGIWRPW